MKKTITLSDGTTVEDSRYLSCGINIGEQHSKYVALSYTPAMGFFLNVKSAWLTSETASEFAKELQRKQEVLLEAKAWLEKQNTSNEQI